MVSLGNRPQLGALEMGLKDLRSSQLMRVPEFQSMYDAIKHHHKEEKLSRLTGKGHVSRNKGLTDTKFYVILAKMLCDVSKNPGNCQETNLNMVYNWYQVNRSQLQSGPRFGKNRANVEGHKTGSSRRRLNKSKSPKGPIRLSYAHAPASVDGCSLGSGGSEFDGNWTLSRSPSPDWDLTSHSYSQLSDEENYEVDSDLVDQYIIPSTNKTASQAHSSSSTPRHHSYRGSDEDSHRKKAGSSVFSSNIKHPISSLVNPHAAPSTASSPDLEDTVTSRIQSPINENSLQRDPSRPSTVADMRSAKLDTWKEFQHDLLLGQDVLGKMSFVGRSGTPYDLRYTAHDQAETPEFNTEQVLTTLHAEDNQRRPSTTGSKCEATHVMSQSLTDFCQTTDGYYPFRQQKYPALARPAQSRDQTPVGRPLDIELRAQSLSQRSTPQSESTSTPNVRLNKLMDVIDDVTSNMTHYKEKLVPAPKLGFRQPASLTPPLPQADGRPSTVPLLGPHVPASHRPASCHGRSQMAGNRPMSERCRQQSEVCKPESKCRPFSAQTSQHGMLPDRPKSANLGILRTRRQLPISPETSPVLKKELSPPTQSVAQALDWRGKVSPDVVSHKWNRSGLGGHSYVTSLKNKKRCASSKRPKTAPVQRSEAKKEQERDWTADDYRSSASAMSHLVVPLNRPVSRASAQHCPENYPPSTSDLHPPGNSPSSARVQRLSENYPPSTSDLHPPGYSPSSARVQRLSENSPSSTQVQRLSENSLSSTNAHRSRTQPLDQDDVDQMLVISYIGGTSEERPPGWFDYDSELLSRLSRCGSSEMRSQPSPSLEFLSLITAKTTLVPTRPSSEFSELTTDKQQVDVAEEKPVSVTRTDSDTRTADSNKPCVGEEPAHSELTEELKLDLGSLQCEAGSIGDQLTAVEGSDNEKGERRTEVPHPPDSEQSIHINPASCTPRGDVQIEADVTCLPEPQSPALHSQARAQPVKRLELHAQVVSNPWTPSWHDESIRPITEEKKVRKKPMTGRASLSVRHMSDPTLVGCPTGNMSVEGTSRRTAGRSVNSLPSSAGVQGVGLGGKMSEDLVAPPRTAPSIPSSHQRHGLRTPRGFQAYMSELEHHARKISSPRQFVEKVSQLRFGADDGESIGKSELSDDISSGVLTVCRLPLPARPIRSDSCTEQQGCSLTCETEESSQPSEGEHDGSTSDKSVFTNANVTRENVLGTRMLQSKLADCSHPDYHTPEESRQDRAKSQGKGRPIPTELEVQNPDEVAARVQKQKEAKAVVDIQRIFRGYIARNYYNGLKKEEREWKEDERAAAIAIQRAFKAHKNKMKAIYNRPKLDPELQSWAQDYDTIKKMCEAERQEKRQQQERDTTKKHLQSSAKLSVIGPHVDIYQIYHQKKTGPTMALLHQAAIVIQKYARGMLVRCKVAALKRKALYHGSNWNRCVQEYRHMVRRVQERHGVIRPVMPFTFTQINVYMDLRRKHESIFEKKAFGGELDVAELPQFFRECDMYPSQAEMDDAVDVVVRGGPEKTSGALCKGDVMEILYHIYPPPAAGLSQHRRSTWMNPIIDGEEANKLIGSECVEEAPLSVCVKLVVNSKRERRQREEAEKKEQWLREDLPPPEPPGDPDAPQLSPTSEGGEKAKKVVFLVPNVEKSEDDS